MRETSLEAYKWLKDEGLIGKRQEIVLMAIINYPNSTDRELCEKLGEDDPNYLRPRRKELLDYGIIKEAGKRVCSISYKNAETWVLAKFTKKSVKSKRDKILLQKKKKTLSDFDRGVIETQNNIRSLIKTIDNRFQKKLGAYFE